MGAHVDLEVTFGSECLAANSALERFVTCVGTHVNVDRTGAGEMLQTYWTLVLADLPGGVAAAGGW